MKIDDIIFIVPCDIKVSRGLKVRTNHVLVVIIDFVFIVLCRQQDVACVDVVQKGIKGVVLEPHEFDVPFVSPRLVEKFEHEDANHVGDVNAPVSLELTPARDLPPMNVVQIQLEAGVAHVLPGTRSALVVHPGHPLQGNPVLSLKVLKGIGHEIISTGPL